MPILKENVYGGPNIGVYLAMNNQYLIFPSKINIKIPEFIKTLHPDLTVIETFIGGSSVVGSLVALNSHGIIVPGSILEQELEILKKSMKKDFAITKIDLEDNAFGNLILCNDKGAIISPKLIDAKQIIEKTLQVPVKVYSFANSDLPGSCGIANNSGVVVHPMVSDSEADVIAEVLQVDIDVSTINCGNPFIGGGVIANDYGALFGKESTGPEIQRILEILNLE